jgi:hypothetical protein
LDDKMSKLVWEKVPEAGADIMEVEGEDAF